MRYLFKRLDQQTTTTAHPQWAMGTHRSAPCLHLDGLVTHIDALIFFEFPLLYNAPVHLAGRSPIDGKSAIDRRSRLPIDRRSTQIAGRSAVEPTGGRSPIDPNRRSTADRTKSQVDRRSNQPPIDRRSNQPPIGSQAHVGTRLRVSRAASYPTVY